MNPALKRREYPEVSYTVIGNLGAGLMGIHPSSRPGKIETYPQLTAETEWAALHHLPVGHNVISVKHTQRGDHDFFKRIRTGHRLAGKPSREIEDASCGRQIRVPAESATRAGGIVESYHVLQVRSGETRVVSVE